MHPYTAAVISRLEQSRTRLRRAVDAVPLEARSRPPEEGRWSVDEVLEHLSLVETAFTRRLTDLLAAARDAGLGPEQAPERAVLPSNIEAIIADRVNRRTAPPAAHPTGALDSASAWEAADRARALLITMLHSADGLALSEVSTAHPAFGAMSVYQVADFLAAHEGRHTAQIEEIAGQLAKL